MNERVVDQAANLRKKIRKQNILEEKANIISVASGKGGVGKSNFVINFAICLQQLKKKVLIFDLDVGMGNIEILLGQQAKYHINHLFKDRLPIEALIEQGPNDIHYISGGSSLDDFFNLSNEDKNYFFQEFAKVENKYDYILFDLGAGATEDSLSFIDATDECIIITTPEPTSLTDAYGMIKHIVNRSPNLSINIVINRSKTVEIGYKVLQGLKNIVYRFLNKKVTELGILPDDTVVTEAVMNQKPYVIYKKNAAISKKTLKITEKFLNEPPLKQRKKSFVHRFMKLFK